MALPDPSDLTRQDNVDGVEQQVVGALIEHDEQILLLRRPLGDFRGGTWELPSGKVDAGEDLITALHREVVEETGLYIAEITSYLGAFDYVSASGKYARQHTWAVTAGGVSGLRLSEHDQHAWADPNGRHPASGEVNALIKRHYSRPDL